ncbi:MAG: hypothetical protein ABH971_02115 [bacterium]
MGLKIKRSSVINLSGKITEKMRQEIIKIDNDIFFLKNRINILEQEKENILSEIANLRNKN